ncbi:hypothetical protein AVEN_129702-1 [Araneus ventricosus]|uniref:Uncharacterized protein n=1 Tax=Araneus ventricosus TaxID=182803 RepID=A0A4Y2DK56_ARAVE|nr:hypothetical protein AVEN_129702-1 [Araneus ventricosus]
MDIRDQDQEVDVCWFQKWPKPSGPNRWAAAKQPHPAERFKTALVDTGHRQPTLLRQDPIGYDAPVQVPRAPEPLPPKRLEKAHVPPEDQSEFGFHSGSVTKNE